MFPKRIILSRKGFDGTAGGCPSPIFQDGTMFSIPIPENGKHKVRTRYEDLGQQGGYQFPKKLVTSSGRGIPLSGQVHLDPDIRPSLRPSFAAAAGGSRRAGYAAIGADAFQEHRGRFVRRVLTDKFAGEGTCQNSITKA